MERAYRIDVDFYDVDLLKTGAKFKQYDRGRSTLIIQPKYDKNIYPILGSSQIHIVYKIKNNIFEKNKSKSSRGIGVLDDTGIIYCTIPDEVIDISGNVLAEIEVISSEGRLTSQTFMFSIVESIKQCDDVLPLVGPYLITNEGLAILTNNGQKILIGVR